MVVNGEWSNWSDYEDCSVTCGSGSQARSRECNSPAPSNGGSTCTGVATQTKDCEKTACPGMFS